MTTSYLNQRLYGVGLSMILVASAAVMPAVAQDAPAGQVQFEVYKAGFIVGVSGGKGTLTFEGEDYPLSIGGVILGATVSLSKADFVGDAFNLTKATALLRGYQAVRPFSEPFEKEKGLPRR